MGENQGILSSVIMTVFVAAFPQRQQRLSSLSSQQIKTYLDDLLENNNEAQRKDSRAHKTRATQISDCNQFVTDLQRLCLEEPCGKVANSQSLPETTTKARPARETLLESVSLHKNNSIYQGTFHAGLLHKPTNLSKAIYDFALFKPETSAFLPVFAIDRVLKQHFTLCTRTIKFLRPNFPSVAISWTLSDFKEIHIQADSTRKPSYKLNSPYNQLHTSELVRPKALLSSGNCLTAHSDQSNCTNPSVTSPLSLGALPSSDCKIQATQPETQSDSTELSESKATKCIPSEQTLSNQPNNTSSVKVNFSASAMDLNDQINNMEGFQMEFGDLFGGVSDEEIYRRINEAERVGENGGEVPVGRWFAGADRLADLRGLGDDEESEIEWEESEDDDSDSFHGSYSNPPLLGRSPLPRRSPSPLHNADAFQDFQLQELSDPVFELREYFSCPSPQSDDSYSRSPSPGEGILDDQSVPNNQIAVESGSMS